MVKVLHSRKNTSLNTKTQSKLKKSKKFDLRGIVGSGLFSKLKDIASTIINKSIGALPLELHLPAGISPTGQLKFYNYCGPGTNLEKRLKNKVEPINQLDLACQGHDVTYSRTNDNKEIGKADRLLADKAWKIFKDPKTPLGEKALSYLVNLAMKTKAAISGSGHRGRSSIRSRKTRRTKARNHTVSSNAKSISDLIRHNAIRELKNHVKGRGYYLRPYPRYAGSGRNLNKAISHIPPGAFGLVSKSMRKTSLPLKKRKKGRKKTTKSNKK